MPNVPPLPDTNELLRWLKARAVLEESLFTRDALTQAVDTIERQAEEIERFRAVLKFLHAYEMGDAVTFVDPNNGDLVLMNYEARALASACLQGPAVG